VAAVAADTVEIAEAALELMDVEYAELAGRLQPRGRDAGYPSGSSRDLTESSDEKSRRFRVAREARRQ
jgi:hypothetical protein